MRKLNLLPCPRSLERQPGFYTLPRAVLHLDAGLPRDTVLLPAAARLQAAAKAVGLDLEVVTGPPGDPRLAIRAIQSTVAPAQAEGYALVVDGIGVTIHYRQEGDLRAAVATLRQLLREYGRRLPRVVMQDYPDFPRRGVMLDVSRGRVPNLQTLLDLAEHLADFKINELQLYIEHTFAYRDYEPVWQGWGPLTGEEMLRLDARCRELGIDLVQPELVRAFAILAGISATEKAGGGQRTLRVRRGRNPATSCSGNKPWSAAEMRRPGKWPQPASASCRNWIVIPGLTGRCGTKARRRNAQRFSTGERRSIAAEPCTARPRWPRSSSQEVKHCTLNFRPLLQESASVACRICQALARAHVADCGKTWF